MGISSVHASVNPKPATKAPPKCGDVAYWLLKEAQAGSSEKDSPNVLLQCNITKEHDSYKRIAKNIDPVGPMFG